MDRFEWNLYIMKWIITSVEHKLVVPSPIQMLMEVQLSYYNICDRRVITVFILYLFYLLIKL